jgi:hypothetical protein
MINDKLLHGDFHFGNFLFFFNNRVNIIILDFGLVFNLSNQQSEYLLDYIETFEVKFFIKFLNEFDNNLDDNINISKLKKIYPNIKSKDNLVYINMFLEDNNCHLPIELYNLLSTIELLKHSIGRNKFKKEDFNEFMKYMIKNKFID